MVGQQTLDLRAVVRVHPPQPKMGTVPIYFCFYVFLCLLFPNEAIMFLVAEEVEKVKVLFICTHNSARSQMAEGYLNYRYGDFYEAFSAGTEPGSLHHLAVQVMKEVGIDISSHRSKSLEEFRGVCFNYVITVCDKAREVCPFFPGAEKYIHAGFDDPAAAERTEEERLAAFRKVRDQIISWIERNFESEEESKSS